MAANTEKVELGPLTIKYAQEYPLTPVQRSKLVQSLDLAKRVVARAIDALETVINNPEPRPSTVSTVAYKVFRGHFKFPRMDLDAALAGQFAGAAWTGWVAGARHAKGVYEALALAFGQRIIIADAHASSVRKQAPLCYEALAKQVGLSPDPAQVPPEHRMVLLQASVLKAEEASRETAGFVSPRRAKVASMSADEMTRRKANDPGVRFTPDEKGSIHINFSTLLGEAKYRNLQVARTLIHEATHKFCDTRDIAYSFEDGYKTMTQAQAILNADSYAYVAVSLYKDHYFADSRAMETATFNMNS